MEKTNGHDPRYSTSRWQKRRAAQLRAEPLCRQCMGREAKTASTGAGPIVPHRGDDHEFWTGDLQSLCAACHSSTKQIEEGRGYSTELGADGIPTDPRHPWHR